MGRVIAVVNQKGGVGKTTTSINLAASLAHAGRRTLLVDFDPQGNASSGVGYPPGKVELSIYEAILGDVEVSDIIRPTEVKNLFLAPASLDLAGAEIDLISSKERERKLGALLVTVADRFDAIIIDCPPSLGILTINALTAADGVIVPMQAEYYALEGLSALLKTIDRVKRSLNPRLGVDGVVFCMHDPRPNLTHQVTFEVKQYLGDQVFETVIPRTIRLAEAPSFGKPILLYDKESKGCQSYISLADELAARRTLGVQKPEKPGRPSRNEPVSEAVRREVAR
jgi:chromosome partitioning protein